MYLVWAWEDTFHTLKHPIISVFEMRPLFSNVSWNVFSSSHTFSEHVGPKHVQKYIENQDPLFENMLVQKIWQRIVQ